jgi:AsnC-type helix-turn-helix domain
MDAIDRKNLTLYQHDTRRVAASIGAEVALSAAAVQRRLKLAYRAFARSRLEIPEVARYETHVVLDRVKVGLSLSVGKNRQN